jgi:hypothetical protein
MPLPYAVNFFLYPENIGMTATLYRNTEGSGTFHELKSATLVCKRMAENRIPQVTVKTVSGVPSRMM